MSASVYFCCLSLLAAVVQGIEGVGDLNDNSIHHMTQTADNQMDKKASSLKYASLGKRTLPHELTAHYTDNLDPSMDKRASSSYKYASLGKRGTADYLDYLQKRSGTFKYGSLGKRSDMAVQESGMDYASKRGASSFKYSSLGKRGDSAFRYSSLGKRGNSAFRYSSLGKRDVRDILGSTLIGNQLPDDSHHRLEKRSARSRDHDILAKRLGYAYKYASVGKRVPVPPDMHKKWFTQKTKSQSDPDPFQRRSSAFRYIGVGKRDYNPGIKYASLGKRQSQWKYAGLGKRSLSDERLNDLLEDLLDQQLNSAGMQDQSYSDLEGVDLPTMDTDDWSEWQ